MAKIGLLDLATYFAYRKEGEAQFKTLRSYWLRGLNTNISTYIPSVTRLLTPSTAMLYRASLMVSLLLFRQAIALAALPYGDASDSTLPFQLTFTPDNTTLLCGRNTRVQSKMVQIFGIRIVNKSETGWNVVAELQDSQDSPAVEGNVEVTGNIQVSNPSLQVSWGNVGHDTFGVFMCDVIGFDSENLYLSERSPEIKITEFEMAIEDIVTVLKETRQTVSHLSKTGGRDMPSFQKGLEDLNNLEIMFRDNRSTGQSSLQTLVEKLTKVQSYVTVLKTLLVSHLHNATVWTGENVTMRPVDNETVRLVENETVRLEENATVRLVKNETVWTVENEMVRLVENKTVCSVENNMVETSENETVRLVKNHTVWTVENETVWPVENETVRPVENETVRLMENHTVWTVENETARPVESETVRPVESETARPVESETARPVESETARSVESETARPVVSETARPVESERARPVESETARPVESETARPVESEAARPVESETAWPVEILWPEGFYALLQPTTGCPEDGFIMVFKIRDDQFLKLREQFLGSYGRQERGRHTSASSPLTNTNEGSRKTIKVKFCSASRPSVTIPWPHGSYCINGILGIPCPHGLTKPSSEIDVDFLFAGLDPGRLETVTHFCCQNRGSTNTPIQLPTSKPFILYRVGGACQTVQGMAFHEEFIEFNSWDWRVFDSDIRPDAYQLAINGIYSRFKYHLCHYTKL